MTRTLADYRPQHDESCNARSCRKCAHSMGYHRSSGCECLLQHNGNWPAHCGCKGEPYDCSCGLDALLAVAAEHAQGIGQLKEDHGAALLPVDASASQSRTETLPNIRALVLTAAQEGVRSGRLRVARRAGERGALAALRRVESDLREYRDRRQAQSERHPDHEYIDGNRDGMWLAWQIASNLLHALESEIGSGTVRHQEHADTQRRSAALSSSSDVESRATHAEARQRDAVRDVLYDMLATIPGDEGRAFVQAYLDRLPESVRSEQEKNKDFSAGS